MKYWHELNTGAQKAIRQSSMTVGQFIRKYKRPDWCGYHRALEPGMGCWSLVTPGSIRKPESCGSCVLKHDSP